MISLFKIYRYINQRENYLTEQRTYNPLKSATIQDLIDTKNNASSLEYFRNLTNHDMQLLESIDEVWTNVRQSWNLPLDDIEGFRNMLFNGMVICRKEQHQCCQILLDLKFRPNEQQIKILQYKCLNKLNVKTLLLLRFLDIFEDVKKNIYEHYIWLVCPHLYF